MTGRSNLLRVGTFLLLAALLVTACGAPAPQPTTEPEAPIKVALVMSGSVADQGYNASAYAALQALETTYGAEIAYSEMVPMAEYEETFRDYSAKGYDVIIGHGFEFGDPVGIVAPDYPDTKYLVVNGIVSGPNYASLMPLLREGTYLAGYICARMSETGKLGAIGGFAYPDIVGQLEAFKLGAQSANPNVEVTIAYVDSFDDIALGKEAALAQISAGADCILHVADSAGIGVIQAAQEEGVWAVGGNYDQNELAPDSVITSVMTNKTDMLDSAIAAILDDSFEWNTIHDYGLGSGVIFLADYHGLVPDDIAADAEKVKQQIISGEVEVPLITEPSQ
jgi:basic membrane protein A